MTNEHAASLLNTMEKSQCILIEPRQKVKRLSELGSFPDQFKYRFTQYFRMGVIVDTISEETP